MKEEYDREVRQDEERTCVGLKYGFPEDVLT
jgi:hypothetical protein